MSFSQISVARQAFLQFELPLFLNQLFLSLVLQFLLINVVTQRSMHLRIHLTEQLDLHLCPFARTVLMQGNRIVLLASPFRAHR